MWTNHLTVQYIQLMLMHWVLLEFLASQFSCKTKFYQASSSEMFGNVSSKKQNEETNFNPISPYAISKLHAHWILGICRKAYNIFCCSGIYLIMTHL